MAAACRPAIGPHAELLRLHQERQAAGRQRVRSRPLGQRLPFGQYCSVAESQGPVGSAAEQFIGDDEANALRKRKQRKPYGITV